MKEYFKHLPSLSTRRLILRRIEERDTDDMYEYSCDRAVSKYLLWSAHESKEQTRKFIRSVIKYYAKQLFYDWAIVEKKSGKMIGTCGFARIDEANNSAELGYVLSRSHWGNGYAPEAAQAVLQVGFCELGLNRIEARYMVENTASARVMEKLGMHPEGVRRQELYIKGQYRDIGYYSILRDEYLSHRNS